MFSDATAFLRDMKRRLANNPDYGWSVASGYTHVALNIVVQILLVPLYLQHLDKVGFGVLMIVLAAINYLGMGVAWVSSGAQRIMGEQAARNEIQDLERTYGLSKVIFIAYALLTAGLAWIAVSALQDRLFPGNPDLAGETVHMLALGIAYMIVLYDLNVDRLALISIAKQALANVLSIISQASFAAAVIPVLANGGGLVGVMAALLLGVVMARICSFVMIRKQGLRLRCPGPDSVPVLRRLLGRMGVGYATYGALLLTLLQADTLILGVLGGPLLVADFVLIWKIADVAMQALWRLPESLVPYLIQMDAKGEHERMKSLYVRARQGMALLAAVSALGFAALGQHIVELWVGTEHAPDAPWAYALAGGALFWMTIARLPAVYAFSTAHLLPLAKVTALETACKIVFLFALFPMLGLYTPMVMTNIAHILGIAYLYQRLFHHSMEHAKGGKA